MTRLIFSIWIAILALSLSGCNTIAEEGEEEVASGSETGDFKGKVVWSVDEPNLPPSVISDINIGLVDLAQDSLLAENIFDTSTVSFDVADLPLGAYELEFEYQDQTIIIEFRITEAGKTTELIIVFVEFFKFFEESSSSSVIFSSQEISSSSVSDSILSSSSLVDSLSSEELNVSSSSQVVVLKDTVDYSLSDVKEHTLPGIVEFEDFVSPGLAQKYGWPFNESEELRHDKTFYNNPQNANIFGLILNYPDLGEKDSTGVEFTSCLCHLEYRFESDGGYNDGSTRGCYLSNNMPSDQKVTSEVYGGETGPWNVCLGFIHASEKLSYLVNFSKKGKYNVHVSGNTGGYTDANNENWSENSPGYPIKIHLYDAGYFRKYATFEDSIIVPHTYPEDGAQWVKVRESQFNIEVSIEDNWPEQMLMVFESDGHPYNLDYIRFELSEGSGAEPIKLENSYAECIDGLDNDDDSLFDCQDIDCAGWRHCRLDDYVEDKDWFEDIKEVHQIPGKVEAEYFVHPGTMANPVFYFFESDSVVNKAGTGGLSTCRQNIQDYFGVEITQSLDSSASTTESHYEGDECEGDAEITYIRNGERLSYALEVDKATSFRVVARVASGFNAMDVYSAPPFVFGLNFYKASDLNIAEKKLDYYILDTGNWFTSYNFIPQQWDGAVVANDNCDKIIQGFEALYSTDQDCWVSELPEDTLVLDSGQWVMEFVATQDAYSLNYFEFIEVK